MPSETSFTMTTIDWGNVTRTDCRFPTFSNLYFLKNCVDFGYANPSSIIGDEQGGYYYIGDGGIRDRWSFKLGIREDENGVPVMPLRNVYVIPDGSIQHRSTVAFRDCLRKEENSDLKEEYGQLKWALAKRKDFVTIWDYADAKKSVVRKVLKRAGWTDEQITAKEDMRVRNWPGELIM